MTVHSLCAVGDSFVFGSELIDTYHADEFSNLSNQERFRLEFESSLDVSQQEKHDSLLDSLRFSSLVAKSLGLKHYNYAQGGSSQEGIKFQAYMLLNYLKGDNIDPADTVWLVGITAASRRLFVTDPHPAWHDMLTAATGDENFVWTRKTCDTLYCDRIDGIQAGFSVEFIKEIIANTSSTQSNLTWVMNILDTVAILKAAGVKHYYFLNFFQSNVLNNIDRNQKTNTLLTNMLNDVDIYPSKDRDMAQHLFNSRVSQCSKGHPDKWGHKQIADYVVGLIKDNIC